MHINCIYSYLNLCESKHILYMKLYFGFKLLQSVHNKTWKLSVHGEIVSINTSLQFYSDSTDFKR